MAHISHWVEAKDGNLSLEAMSRKLRAKGYKFLEHSYEVGTVLRDHTHGESRKMAILSGQIQAIVGGKDMVLKAGDVLDVPVGVERHVTVVSTDGVQLLDACLTDLQAEHWVPAKDGVLSEHTVAKKLASQGFAYMKQILGPGTVLSDHAHREPTKDAIVSGQLKLTMFGKSVLLGPGDMIEIPTAVEHGASVVGNEPCVMYECSIVSLNVMHWNAPVDGILSADTMGAKLKKQGYHYTQQVYAPGMVLHDHTHDHTMKDAVITGELRCAMHDKEVVLGPGDILTVPAGVQHSASVVGKHHVVILEAEKGSLKVHHWNKSVDGELSAEALERKLRYYGYDCTPEQYAPGTVHDEHSHPEPRMDAVLAGQMKVRMFGQEVLLSPGDMIEIPIGTDHHAEVVGAGQTTLLEGKLGLLIVEPWSNSRDGALTEEGLGNKLKARGYHYTRHEQPLGTVSHDHAHQEPHKEAVISGQLKFEMFGRVVVLNAGDIITIPFGIEHGTTVVGVGPAITLDAVRGNLVIERWDNAHGAPTAESLAAKLSAAGYHSIEERYDPGTVLHEHAHGEPRRDAVVSGRLKVSMFGKEAILMPGDIVDVPMGVDHDAAVFGDEPVVLLEAAM